jgi:3-phenylpropionate/trans-cinnamate dioxygenase ferredoxin reductase subunit
LAFYQRRAEPALTGPNGPHNWVTDIAWFWFDQYDCNLRIAGLNAAYDAVYVKTLSGSPNMRVHWYFRQGQLIAGDAINARRDYMIAKSGHAASTKFCLAPTSPFAQTFVAMR